MGEAERLGQILVQPERAGDGPADLRDFEAVGEADAEMIAVRRDEDLGLVAEPAERDGMDDPVAVALEGVAGAPLPALAFTVKPPAAGGRIGGEMAERPHLAPSFSIFCPAALVQAKALRPPFFSALT